MIHVSTEQMTGLTLVALRKAIGLNRNEFCLLAYADTSSIARSELGNTEIRIAKLRTILYDVYGISLQDFFKLYVTLETTFKDVFTVGDGESSTNCTNYILKHENIKTFNILARSMVKVKPVVVKRERQW